MTELCFGDETGFSDDSIKKFFSFANFLSLTYHGGRKNLAKTKIMSNPIVEQKKPRAVVLTTNQEDEILSDISSKGTFYEEDAKHDDENVQRHFCEEAAASDEQVKKQVAGRGEILIKNVEELVIDMLKFADMNFGKVEMSLLLQSNTRRLFVENLGKRGR